MAVNEERSNGGNTFNKVLYGGVAAALTMATAAKTNIVSNVTKSITDHVFKKFFPYMNQYHRAQGISLKIRYGMLKKFGSGGRERPIKVVSRDINDRLFDKTDAHEATLFRQEYYDMQDINTVYDDSVENTNNINNSSNNNNNNNNTISIVNIGNKKKGKSFNSSILSLFLTKRPILFESNHDGRNLTTGIDISPKLELDAYHFDRINNTSFNMHNINNRHPNNSMNNRNNNENKYKYVSIMDMEGNDPKLNESDKIDLKALVFNKQYPCVIVHACSQFIDDNDVDLALSIFKLINIYNIPYIITCHSTHPEYKIENDENYLTLRKQNDNIYFCQPTYK